MAHRAIRLEQRRAAPRRRARLLLTADDAHMADAIGDLPRVEAAVAPAGRHPAGARRLVVGIPDAIRYRIVARRPVAPPPPVVVGRAGIDLRPPHAARTVALHPM